MERILRLHDVCAQTGMGATTIWRREKAGDFPRRRQIGPRAVGWVASEVQEWIRGRPPAQLTDDVAA